MTTFTDLTPTQAKRERSRIRRERVTRNLAITCTRCGGAGQRPEWAYTGHTCFKCGGAGTVRADVRVYLDPAVEQRDDALTQIIKHDEHQKVQAKWEAERTEREARDYDAAWDNAHDDLRVMISMENRRAKQEFIGEVGARLTATGIVTVAVEVNGFYGSSKLVVIETADGNLVKTFGTGTSLWHTKKGDAVEITGRVKDHETYVGDKQTCLTRCKITPAG